MMGFGYGWIFMFFGGLIVIGIIVLIVFALVHAANESGRSGASAQHETKAESASRALAILAERYASGEISEEEYRQKKNVITGL
jgi:putative membrane protein